MKSRRCSVHTMRTFTHNNNCSDDEWRSWLPRNRNATLNQIWFFFHWVKLLLFWIFARHTRKMHQWIESKINFAEDTSSLSFVFVDDVCKRITTCICIKEWPRRRIQYNHILGSQTLFHTHARARVCIFVHRKSFGEWVVIRVPHICTWMIVKSTDLIIIIAKLSNERSVRWRTWKKIHICRSRHFYSMKAFAYTIIFIITIWIMNKLLFAQTMATVTDAKWSARCRLPTIRNPLSHSCSLMNENGEFSNNCICLAAHFKCRNRMHLAFHIEFQMKSFHLEFEPIYDESTCRSTCLIDRKAPNALVDHSWTEFQNPRKLT